MPDVSRQVHPPAQRDRLPQLTRNQRSCGRDPGAGPMKRIQTCEWQPSGWCATGLVTGASLFSTLLPSGHQILTAGTCSGRE